MLLELSETYSCERRLCMHIERHRYRQNHPDLYRLNIPFLDTYVNKEKTISISQHFLLRKYKET